MSCVLVEILIVTAHYAPRASFDNRRMERAQVEFVQGTVGNPHIHMVAEGFLLVKRVMFYAASHAIGLKPLDVRHTHPRSKIRVFAKIFKVATVEGRAVQVHAGTQQNILFAVTGLFTYHPPVKVS